MRFAPHFFSSIVLSVLLFPFFGLYALFALIGGFLVDVDHYLYFIARTRRVSPRLAWDYYEERKFLPDRPTINVFHTVEAFAALVLLSMYNTAALALTSGFVLHMALDFAESVYKKEYWDDRSNSIVYWLLSRKQARAQISRKSTA